MFVLINIRKLRAALFALFVLLAVVAAGVLLFKQFYPIAYEEEIERYAGQYSVDPVLLYAMINVESGFRPDVTSPKGAKGLMQIMDQTGYWGAGEIGIPDFEPDRLYDPAVNIQIGCWYINTLSREFNGDTELLLAAYNAGSGNVAKWLRDEQYSDDGRTLRVVPFEETRRYIGKVNKNMSVYRYLVGERD